MVGGGEAVKKNRPLWNILFVLYGCMMLALLFGRNSMAGDVPYWQQVWENISLQPFHTIPRFMDVLLRKDYYLEKWGSALVYAGQARLAVVNLVGNVVMFVPLGFLLPKVSARQRKFWRAMVTTALIILLVEMIQLFSLRGICDVDDLILNVLGAAIGYGIYKIFAKK